MSQASQPQERKIAIPFEEKLLRPVGGLTYCISAGWERTSNLALLLPSSKLGASGNNSFSDCWSRQCPWYWKPTALGVSNLQSKQFKSNLNSLDLFVHLVQFVFNGGAIWGFASVICWRCYCTVYLGYCVMRALMWYSSLSSHVAIKYKRLLSWLLMILNSEQDIWPEGILQRCYIAPMVGLTGDRLKKR